MRTAMRAGGDRAGAVRCRLARGRGACYTQGKPHRPRTGKDAAALAANLFDAAADADAHLPRGDTRHDSRFTNLFV